MVSIVSFGGFFSTAKIPTLCVVNVNIINHFAHPEVDYAFGKVTYMNHFPDFEIGYVNGYNKITNNVPYLKLGCVMANVK